MKNYFILAGLIGLLIFAGTSNSATILYPGGGGTGTSTAPTYGKILVGTSAGVYQLQATSTLGITATESYTGTVTSVDASVPTGLSVSGVPFTTAGTIALTYTAGYAIPTTTRMLNWDLASTHKITEDALNGLVKVDGAGAYSAITDSSFNWNTAYGWGNHATVGYIPNAYYATTTHPLISSLPSLSITSGQMSDLASYWDNRMTGTTTLPKITTLSGLSITKSQVSDFGTYESVLTFGYPLTRAANAISLAFGTTTSNTWNGTQTFTNNIVGNLTGTASGNLTTIGSGTNGYIPYWIGSNLLGASATGTITCAGTASCGAGSYVLGNNLTITATGGSGVGTVSTSTTPLLGGIAYWTSANYPSLLGTIGTSTLTASAPLSLDNPVVKIGATASVLTLSTVGTWSGLAGTASALAADPTDCSANTWANTIAASGNLTCSAVTSTGISDMASYFDNRLTGTTTLSKLTTLVGLTTVGTIGTGVWNATAIDEAKIDWVVTGQTIDFGGATSFELPNATSPTIDAAGEMAIDTTTGQLRWFNGGTHIVTGTSTPMFSMASTTMDNRGISFGTGTTTRSLGNILEPFTITGVYCKATSTAASTAIGLIRFQDGSGNYSNTATCNTTGVYTLLTTNNAFTLFEDFIVEASSTESSLDILSITVSKQPTAD